MMDFLLSLSAKAKDKLAKAKLPENTNKSVIYADQVLGEDDVSTLFYVSNPVHDSRAAAQLTVDQIPLFITGLC